MKKEARESCVLKSIMIFTPRIILSVLLHQEYEMGGECGTHEIGSKCIRFPV